MSSSDNTSLTLVDIKGAGGKLIVQADLASKQSVAEAAIKLIEDGQLKAAEALLDEAETLHVNGITVNLVLVTDTSGSMDGAGQVERMRLALPGMIRAATGEIPVHTKVRHVCFGDAEYGDHITRFDWADLNEVTNRNWPKTSGGDGRYESPIEALLAAIGQHERIGYGAEGCLRGKALSPLTGEGYIVLVTDHERPRQISSQILEVSRLIPSGWRLGVVAQGNEDLWRNLMREGDRFCELDGSLSGLVEPVGQAVVTQAKQTAKKVAKSVQAAVQANVLMLADGRSRSSGATVTL